MQQDSIGHTNLENEYMWDKHSILLFFYRGTYDLKEYLILSRDKVAIDGVWIGNWSYWTLETRNYK
jgi:hypothetical protein